MRRAIFKDLVHWKESSNRKPLLLYGARQVGKTYILKEFGKREFTNMVYINCDQNTSVKNLFKEGYNIKRILQGLSILSEERILPDSTLIFFDEVQEIPEIITSLKYFYEEEPSIFVVAAGSLLGIQDLKGYSFPVGKVDIMHLYPMTFIEFLWALNEDSKADILKEKGNESLINGVLPSYIDLLRKYYFVGGMPEAVKAFKENKRPDEIRKIQNNLLEGYYADISKHSGKEAQKCHLILESIPSQLAKENKKFVYGAIKKGARAKEFENAIQWLVDAGLIYKVNKVNKAEVPLKFYIDIDAFKLFLFDVGILGAIARTPPEEIMIGDKIFSEYKGAFTENYLLTQLKPIEGLTITYYAKTGSSLEIDFIVQKEGKIYPIEVKAEENVKSKSLRQFILNDNKDAGFHGYRFSMKGFRTQDWITNIPLVAPVYLFMENDN